MVSVAKHERIAQSRAAEAEGQLIAIEDRAVLGPELRLEDEVRIYPEMLTARVRGLQKHGAAATEATAGQRPLQRS